MIRHLVFWGLCAVLLFVPIPFGSVEPWAEFVFEAATLVLFILYIAGEMRRSSRAKFRHARAEAVPPPGLETRSGQRRRTVPLLIKILLAAFLVVCVAQFVPLPPGVVKVLSPKAAGIYAGLAREALGGWQDKSWWTLSLVPLASIAKFILVLCYGLFAFLVVKCVRTRPKMEIFVLVMIASGLFQSFYGLAEHFSGSEEILGFKKTAGIGSATGTYVNRNHYAGFLEMIFPMSLGYMLAKARYFLMEKGMGLRSRILWFAQERLQWTMLLGLVTVFIGTGLVFSKSRSGILVFLLTILLAAVCVSGWRTFAEEEAGDSGQTGRTSPAKDRLGNSASFDGIADGNIKGIRGGQDPHGRKVGNAPTDFADRKRFARIVRLVFAVVLAAALWLGIGPILKRFTELDISRSERRTFMKNTLELIGDFPLAGAGKGTYVHSYAMYEKVDDWHKLSYTHNDYLQTLAEYGIVGGGCLIGAGLGIVILLAAGWRRRRDNFAKAIGLGAILGVVAILVHGITDFNLQIPANAVYFVAFVALGLNALRGMNNRDSGPRWSGGGEAWPESGGSGLDAGWERNFDRDPNWEVVPARNKAPGSGSGNPDDKLAQNERAVRDWSELGRGPRRGSGGVRSAGDLVRPVSRKMLAREEIKKARERERVLAGRGRYRRGGSRGFLKSAPGGSRSTGNGGLAAALPRAAALACAALLLLSATNIFLGHLHLSQYEKPRTEVRSIEGGFGELDALLLKAWRSSENSEIAKARGRLYSEMARVANEAGRPDQREEFCDLAVAAYTDSISRNPVDAFSHFEMGMIYILSNYPMMVYADRAKLYFREALALKPADQFLHIHILLVYLTLWDILDPAEQEYVRERYRRMAAVDPAFAAKLEEQWKKSFGETDRFRELLSLF